MTKLTLAGMDAGPGGALVFRFVEGGRAMSWEFRGASYPEFLALLLDGRLGGASDVHFDAAQVTVESAQGREPGQVKIAIGRKATIVAPLPGKAAAGN